MILRRTGLCLQLAALLGAAPGYVGAQTPATDGQCPMRPAFPAMRYEENWRFLADPSCRTDPWDRVKYIDLGPERYLSLGGDARIRYERFENPGFGQGVDDRNGYLLQRYLFHGDLHLGPRLRFFGQLESALVDGRRAGPRPTDENRIDVNQMFVEWRMPLREHDWVAVRAGRQEVELGSAQFTSARDGLNDRLSFDGVRALGEIATWRFHAMATRVVPVNPGPFDDASGPDATMSGFYLARSHTLLPDGNGVGYASRRTRSNGVYADATGAEERITAGTRWWGRGEQWDYSLETGIQRGRLGGSDIRAWYVNTDNGWTWPEATWRPRLGIRFSIGSGDGTPGDGVLGTFSPLFAATAYSGLAGLVGPSNSVNIAPSLRFQLSESVLLTAGTSVFWRQSLSDGIYDIASDMLRPPGSSDARHVGTQPTLQVTWMPTRHVTIFTTLSYFRTGRFLRETPPGENVTYFTMWWAYRF